MPTIVFAYGSNMLAERMLERAPSAKLLEIGELLRYRLVWHKRSKDGSGKCSVVATKNKGDSVWGVLYELSQKDKESLDRTEGLGYGYAEKQVKVRTASGNSIVAWTYIATEIEEGLRPYRWYRDLVEAGAKQQHLPLRYVESIANVECADRATDTAGPKIQRARTMAKATITLPGGAVVLVDGNTEEIKELLAFYGGDGRGSSKPKAKEKIKPRRKPGPKDSSETPDTLDLNVIVNLVKDTDEAELIEKHILDRSSQVDRILLPLYVVHELMKASRGLSSGEISKVTAELGVPVSISNASTTLSGTAAKYVMGDRTRKKGQPVRYRLSRRGLQYMKAVITGKQVED